MIDQRDVERKLDALTRKAARPKPKRWPLLAGAVAGVLALPFVAYYVDTMAFPVISDANTVIMQDAGGGRTSVVFVYNKNRECRITGMSFVLGGNLIEPLTVDNMPALAPRPVGRNVSRRFILNTTPDDFIKRAIVTLEHECHGLWHHRARLFGQ
jgi:hypothetical protein